MFVIEGADHLGKTTAAKLLVQIAAEDAPTYPVRYQHMSRQNAAFDFRTDYLDMISKYAVQDRFHLGAIGYHEPGTLTPDALQTVQRWLKEVGSYVVLFYSSDVDWYVKHLRSQPKEEMFDVEVMVEANRRFNELRWDPSVQIDLSWDVSLGWPSRKAVTAWLFDWYHRMNRLPCVRRSR
jgi:hypothetical protein